MTAYKEDRLSGHKLALTQFALFAAKFQKFWKIFEFVKT